MKRIFIPATVLAFILVTATFVWADGMGGRMDDGMMDGGGQQMGPVGQDFGHYDQDRSQRQHDAWQRGSEGYNRDMPGLNDEMRQQEQALNGEMQENRPDEAGIENQRHELQDPGRRYNERWDEFENEWHRNDWQE